MKAFVHGNGALKIDDVKEPEAGAGEVVVGLKVAGMIAVTSVCRSVEVMRVIRSFSARTARVLLKR